MVTNSKIIDDFDFIRDRLKKIKEEENGIALPSSGGASEQETPRNDYQYYRGYCGSPMTFPGAHSY